MHFDVIVIGGGFYGCELARQFRAKGYSVLIVERSNKLLTRASYVNQARVHNGYHYPRDYITAKRSHVNFQTFVRDYSYAIDSSFTKLYAIAKHNSKVASAQFLQFCRKVGSPIAPAAQKYQDLFDMSRIDAVYEVQEYAFNAVALRNRLALLLEKERIPVTYGVEADRISCESGKLTVFLNDETTHSANLVINATYSRINDFLHKSSLPLLPFKHEVIEMAVIEPPSELRSLGVTVMDGPYFSTMPFPAEGLHSLSHVHYTPVVSWSDDPTQKPVDPYQKLNSYPKVSKVEYMIKDGSRYLPCLQKATYRHSLYEVKTVLLDNEDNDGRPILFRKDYGLKGFCVVMGGKIDNIYDIILAFKREGLL
ncbi:MAG: FAD-binding oxidoreductase [Patescibacteria group bacterium]|nr:FAD-binding oxidoreductase [Patescibacteria group bacterium]